jgi:hypothetical protein
MKSKLVIAALVVMAAMMIASLSSALATTWYPVLTISNKEVVWVIDTMKLFSGQDVLVTSILINYWYRDAAGVLTQGPQLFPVKVSQSGWQVKLWFDPATFPETAEFSVVTGLLANGDDFSAQGPGWTWNRVG